METRTKARFNLLSTNLNKYRNSSLIDTSTTYSRKIDHFHDANKSECVYCSSEGMSESELSVHEKLFNFSYFNTVKSVNTDDKFSLDSLFKTVIKIYFNLLLISCS